MTQPNQDLVQAASAFFGRRDLGALQDQFLAPDIVWHVAGTSPLAGDYQGMAQVMGMLAKISEVTGGTIEHELHDVLVSTDHTVVLATLRAQRAGRQLQDNIVHVIHGANGKAAEIWTSSFDPAGAAAFWSAAML